LLEPGAGRSVSLGPTRVGFKVESTDARGASLVEFEAAPGFDTGLHVHERLEEIFFVTGGEFEFHAGEDAFHATPGACVFVPPGVPHAFANRTEEPATLLLVMSPPTHDRYFDELASIVDGDGPHGEEIAALRERYDTKQLSSLDAGRA
jgi:mannose-6-phosphate isomerase-like protein (cupin superfamily)